EPVRRGDGMPAGGRFQNRSYRYQLVAQSHGPHRPQRPAPGGLRTPLYRDSSQSGYRRGAGTGQALRHGPVVAIRERHSRPADPRRRPQIGAGAHGMKEMTNSVARLSTDRPATDMISVYPQMLESLPLLLWQRGDCDAGWSSLVAREAHNLE